MYPLFKDDPAISIYMPDSLPQNKLPAREYFFTILNSVYPEYLAEAIAKANKLRYGSDEQQSQSNEIVMTNEWFEKLNSLPFFSSK